MRADLRFLIFFGRVLTSLIHNRTNRRRFDTGMSSRYLHQVLLIVPTTKVGPCHHAWTFTTLNSFLLVGSLESIIPGTQNVSIIPNVGGEGGLLELSYCK